MGLTADRIAEAVSALGKLDPRFAEAAGRHGLPEPRIREPGYETLLRAIVSQQANTAAATTHGITSDARRATGSSVLATSSATTTGNTARVVVKPRTPIDAINTPVKFPGCVTRARDAR